jgi:hypothetical protein
VRFRYNADSGEVESFGVEDNGRGARAVDHDARHDRVTADVARIVERDALIEEVLPGSLADLEDPGRHGNTMPGESEPTREERRVRE